MPVPTVLGRALHIVLFGFEATTPVSLAAIHHSLVGTFLAAAVAFALVLAGTAFVPKATMHSFARAVEDFTIAARPVSRHLESLFSLLKATFTGKSSCHFSHFVSAAATAVFAAWITVAD